MRRQWHEVERGHSVRPVNLSSFSSGLFSPCRSFLEQKPIAPGWTTCPRSTSRITAQKLPAARTTADLRKATGSAAVPAALGPQPLSFLLHRPHVEMAGFASQESLGSHPSGALKGRHSKARGKPAKQAQPRECTRNPKALNGRDTVSSTRGLCLFQTDVSDSAAGCRALSGLRPIRSGYPGLRLLRGLTLGFVVVPFQGLFFDVRFIPRRRARLSHAGTQAFPCLARPSLRKS